jgi:hypothetical protein
MPQGCEGGRMVYFGNAVIVMQKNYLAGNPDRYYH